MPGLRLSSLLVVLALAASAETKVLTHFTLIDGTGREPLPDAAMIVNNGRIQWVGAASMLKSPAGAEVIDLAGKYVMPGIINLHGHLGNVIDLTQNPKFFTRENLEKNLKTYASYGVTTVLSMGTDQDEIFKIRDEQRDSGRPLMTRVFTAGRGFTAKGGYGGLAGVTFALDGNSQIDKDVAELKKEKVDIVKIWVDDHLGTMKKMPLDMSKGIIDSAHRQGLRVAAHIFYLQDAQQLTDAGVNGLAHSVRDKLIDPQLIASMKAQGTWQIAATLTREASMFVYGQTPPFADDPFFTRAVSPKVLSTLKDPAYQKKIASDKDFAEYPTFLENAKHNLKTLVDAGVKYGFGTDSGPPGRFPGFFEQWEMELMVDAGLTPQQVIAGATKNAAEFLQAKELGTLERGKWADLIVVEKNPLADIRNTRSIDAVYIAGNRAFTSR
jgi:imidazolonepropionase-like amidohydrolase